MSSAEPEQHKTSRTIASIVVAACLALAVVLSVIDKEVPATVIAVLLSCGVAALLYGILGEVESARLNLPVLQVGGSAAVLLGAWWLMNEPLATQLDKIRTRDHARVAEGHAAEIAKAREEARNDAIRKMRFEPPENVGELRALTRTGRPRELSFDYPVFDDGEFQTKSVKIAAASEIDFTLAPAEGDETEFAVKAKDAQKPLGGIGLAEIEAAVGLRRDLEPRPIWGPRKVRLPSPEIEVPEPLRHWGMPDCDDDPLRPPFVIEAIGMGNNKAGFHVRSCGANEVSKRTWLAQDEGEIFRFDFDGKERMFVVAVVEADHEPSPPPGTLNPEARMPWSRFVVIELQ